MYVRGWRIRAVPFGIVRVVTDWPATAAAVTTSAWPAAVKQRAAFADPRIRGEQLAVFKPASSQMHTAIRYADDAASQPAGPARQASCCRRCCLSALRHRCVTLTSIHNTSKNSLHQVTNTRTLHCTLRPYIQRTQMLTASAMQFECVSKRQARRSAAGGAV
ncbi:hypothetical protein Y032_0035g3066 [Ancylostoma ceylanicum]|uniref:Uncharacterized protein n=1 Tax=Ancylostoma ceylanicum TaxID=53326 RepID=A0A016UKQ4_9BILA|nr:hypothetical protein Y032_0035g3066 [Ancylostoma ceylanicum]